MKKEETITLREGQIAQWINGKLVITNHYESIKTFNDAYEALGKTHRLCLDYNSRPSGCSPALKAFLVLRIVVAALNNGWTPKSNDNSWMPVFYIVPEVKLDGYSESEREKMIKVQHGDKIDYIEIYAISESRQSVNGSYELALKNEELTKYCAKQFSSLWLDYIRPGDYQSFNELM